MVVAQLTECAEVAGRRRVHAALALDGLDHDSDDGLVDRRGEGVEIAPGHVKEPGGERLERLVLLRLPGRGEGRERPAMEAAVGGNDLPAPVLSPTPLAGDLDGAFVGLGTAVGEEHPAAAAEQAIRVTATSGPTVVPNKFDTWQSVRACSATASATAGWAWPSDVHGEPAQEVEVSPAVGVPELGTRATHERHRRRGRIGGHQGVTHRLAVLSRTPSSRYRRRSVARAAGRERLVRRGCARPATPLRIACRHDAAFGVMPSLSAPEAMRLSSSSASRWLIRVGGSSASRRMPSTFVR